MSSSPTKRIVKRGQVQQRAPRPFVLTRTDSESERLVLIRRLQQGSVGGSQRLSVPDDDDDDDNVSVQSGQSTKSWWRRGRSTRVDDAKSVATGRPPRGPRRKNKTVARQTSSRQFEEAVCRDAQSIASQPTFVGSYKPKRLARQQSEMISRDAGSARSSRSFRGIFLSFRKGSEAVDLEDDDITMASGLGFPAERDDHGGGDDHLHSGHPLDPPFLRSSMSEGALLAPTKLERRPSVFNRLFRKRRKSLKINPSTTTPVAEAKKAPVTPRTTLHAKVHKNQAADEEVEVMQATTIAPVRSTKNESKVSASHRVDRWSPIPQFDEQVAPKAPKRPVRQVDEFDFQPIAQDEAKAEDSDDDESVISLLSGILATWSSGREAAKPGAPKSCFKSIMTTPSFKPRCSVTFDRIKIREYERTLGDNPSCSSGPPLSIGWTCLYSYDYPIDEYERSKPRRTKREFHLPAVRRNDLLVREWGCSEEDIRRARREATYIQYCREKSAYSGARQQAREAAAIRKANQRLQKMGPQADTSDTAQPQPVQLRHRSSIELGFMGSARTA